MPKISIPVKTGRFGKNWNTASGSLPVPGKIKFILTNHSSKAQIPSDIHSELLLLEDLKLEEFVCESCKTNYVPIEFKDTFACKRLS